MDDNNNNNMNKNQADLSGFSNKWHENQQPTNINDFPAELTNRIEEIKRDNYKPGDYQPQIDTNNLLNGLNSVNTNFQYQLAQNIYNTLITQPASVRIQVQNNFLQQQIANLNIPTIQPFALQPYPVPNYTPLPQPIPIPQPPIPQAMPLMSIDLKNGHSNKRKRSE